MRSDSDVMSSHDVARLFRVHPATVNRWADAGLLPCFRTPGGARRFRRSDVLAAKGVAQVAEDG